MVKKHAVTRKNTVAFAVVDGYPVGIDLCRCIRAPGVERGPLALSHLLHLAVHFRAACLIKFRFQPVSLIASKIRIVPKPVTSPVYSGMSNSRAHDSAQRDGNFIRLNPAK
jgi:hypothetical protein